MTLEEYVRSIREKSIGIIGIGVSNEPLITMLLSAGCHVTACDKCSPEEMGERHRSCLLSGLTFVWARTIWKIWTLM